MAREKKSGKERERGGIFGRSGRSEKDGKSAVNSASSFADENNDLNADDIDISELLKKYMPEVDDDGDGNDGGKSGSGESVLSALRADAENSENTEKSDEHDELGGALSLFATSVIGDDSSEEEDEEFGNLLGLASRLDSVITEYDINESESSATPEEADVSAENTADEPVIEAKAEESTAYSDEEIDIIPTDKPASKKTNESRADKKSAKREAKLEAKRAKEEKKSKQHEAEIPAADTPAESNVVIAATEPKAQDVSVETVTDEKPQENSVPVTETEADNTSPSVNAEDFEDPIKTKPSLFVDDFAKENIEATDSTLNRVLTEDELMAAAAESLAADAEAAGKAAADMVQNAPQNVTIPEIVDTPADGDTLKISDIGDIRNGAKEESKDGAAESDSKDGDKSKDKEDSDLDGIFGEDKVADAGTLNLMVALGMDKGESDNATRAKELGDIMENDSKSEKHNKATYLERPEFVDRTQIPAIKKEFESRKITLWIRGGICLLLTLGLMIFENLQPLTKLFIGEARQFSGVIDPAVYPVVYIMVSLQIMLFAALCAFDEIMAGLKNLFRGTPRPESLTAMMVFSGIIYSGVSASFSVISIEPKVYNFVPALACLFTIIYSIINCRREMLNFKVVTDKHTKHIVRRMSDMEAVEETKAYADRDDICDVMKIDRTNFVEGFFVRLQKPNQTTTTFMSVAVWIPFLVAVICGVAMGFRGKSGLDVSAAVYSSLLILCPISVYFTFAYPFYRANVIAKKRDCAIIGETAIEEYSNASIISFDDTNIFPSEKVRISNIRTYNKVRFDRILYYTASVFAYAGGPLKNVFSDSIKDLGISDNVQIVDSGYGYLEATVDGREIRFGSYEVLKENGFEIPEEAVTDDVELSNEIMFVFLKDKFVAKMYIKYEIDSDIESILKQFANSNMYVCVRTFDPNINEDMIARNLNIENIPLRIVPYTKSDDVSVYKEKADSGLVTCGSPKNLLHTISYCSRVLRTKKTDIAISILSIFIGSAILALLFLADSFGIVNSLTIAIYQLLWCVPTIITSRVYVR